MASKPGDRKSRFISPRVKPNTLGKLLYWDPTTEQTIHVDLGNLTVVNNAIVSPSSGTYEPSNGDKTDIVVTDDGLTWTIDSNVVSYSKIQQVAAYSILANSTSGAANVAANSCSAFMFTVLTSADAAALRTNAGVVIGTNVQAYDALLSSIASLGTAADKYFYTTGIDTVAEAAITAFARSLLDDAGASDMRTTLGLGTLATQNGTFSGTSSGTNTGDQTTAGTLDRITVTNGATNPVIDIAATYVGQASINTLGTITTGVWNGTDIAFANIVSASAASKLVGRRSGSAGDFEEITLGTNLSMSGTTLNATGGSGGLSDADYGDITVSGSGTVMTIDNDVVTYAKMQNVSAQYKILGRSTAGAGDVEELSTSADMVSLLASADYSAARTNLGLVIGTNVQAYDAKLAALAGLTSAADALPYFTGAGTASTTTLTSAARTVLDDATVADMVNTLGGAASTGSNGLVRTTSPTLVTPNLGTPTSGDLTNCTGTASGLTAGTVTTNANLTGEITSSGNAAVLDKTAVTNRSADTAPDSTTDYVLTYDDSAADLKKVLLNDLKIAIGAINLGLDYAIAANSQFSG